ncbi:MAG: hypothetical protein PHI32_10830 [Dysgonamonadaceae bacterium]|nr:hypothetical protein [Dysgonamonadaceae bacterium]
MVLSNDEKHTKRVQIVLSNDQKHKKQMQIVLFNAEKHKKQGQIVHSNAVKGIKLTLRMDCCDKMIHIVKKSRRFWDCLLGYKYERG